jgi:hypothetical protein
MLTVVVVEEDYMVEVEAEKSLELIVEAEAVHRGIIKI